MSAPFNWTCPHCNKPQTVTEGRHYQNTTSMGVSNLAEGNLAFERTVIGCSNPDCKKVTVWLRIGQDTGQREGWQIKHGTEIFSEQIVPRDRSKPQPDFIPAALREDYYEACLIRDLSPKASATLSRRCLQGMIRDFCGISKKRLIDEINALKEAVGDGSADRSISLETVVAIDHLRSLGNIGAHMEADIDVIVPVDSGEAQAMIDLVEMLFDDWYGDRERRRERLANIERIRSEKDEIKRAAKETRGSPAEGVSAEAAAEQAAE